MFFINFHLKTELLQAIMDSYDKLTRHDDEDDDTYEEDI